MGCQKRVISRGVMTEDEFGTGTRLDAQALGADGHTAVGADPDGGTNTPDKRPPRAAWHGTKLRAFFLEGEIPGLLGFHLKFTVDFVLVAVPA